MLPLQGIRVIDLTWAGAGPYASLQLGWLGAQVIKVEWGDRPDVSRSGFYRRRTSPVSPQFNDLNLNKLSLATDLRSSSGIELMHRLLGISDVLMASYRPGVLQRLGLDYESLCKFVPDIVVATVSSAGQDGPESTHAGFASIFSVQGGLGTLTGYPDMAPVALGDSIDLRVGNAVAFGVLAALYHRRQTGQGRLVDVSAREVVSNALGFEITDFSMNGRLARRSSNQLRGTVVHDLYRCAGDDEWVSIVASTDEDFGSLCGVIGRPGMFVDPELKAAQSRAGHRVEIDAAVEAWTLTKTVEEATDELQQAGISAMPYRSAGDIANDEHLRSRGFFVDVPQEDLGLQSVMQPAWRLGKEAFPFEPGAPLGIHNRYIFEELLGGETT